jgi:hypothetical protein
MDCLLAASRHITRALVACRRDGTLPGADEVLPALILVVKESNPPGLRTALEAVQRYRHPRRLQVSEAAYVFTNVASAVHFLETVRACVSACVALLAMVAQWKRGGGRGVLHTGMDKSPHGTCINQLCHHHTPTHQTRRTLPSST